MNALALAKLCVLVNIAVDDRTLQPEGVYDVK